MIITREQLQQISPSTPASRIETFIHHFNTYLPKYGIDTPTEVASFLAQVLHESGGLKWLREIWGPTPAQARYEGRADLGNTQRGDGKKFSGRGLMHITGRANTRRMSLEMFGDERLLDKPDLLATPEYAVQSACIYWKWIKGDLHDDDLNILKETRLVNGGYTNIEEREMYFKRALEILNK